MRLYRLLVHAFPRAWRETYQDELLALVAEEAHRRRQAFDMVRAGLRERRRAWTPASVEAPSALLVAAGSLLLCWQVTASPQTQRLRWLLTAAFLGLFLFLLVVGLAPHERNRMTSIAVRRALIASFIAVSAGSTTTVLVSTASSHPTQTRSPVASTPRIIPASPSIQATLSPQVAATPGIVAYLQSNRPKSEEFIDGHTVWVGTGNPTYTSHGLTYSQTGDTIAGTYQPVTFSNNTPTTWPTESVVAVSAGS